MKQLLKMLSLLLVGVVFLCSAATLSRNSTATLRLPSEMKDILEGAEKFTLYSIDPDSPPENLSNKFPHYRELGKTQIPRSNERTNLVRLLCENMQTNSSVFELLCFNPRHAIRAEWGTNRVELTICFECAKSYCSINGGKSFRLVTLPAPEATLDDYLKKAGVPLAKKPS